MNELFTLQNTAIILVILCIALIALFAAFVIFAKALNARFGRSIKLINDLYNLSQKQGKALAILEQDAKNSNNDEHIALQLEVSELRQQVTELNKQVLCVESLAQQLQHNDPELKMYNKANQLVASGMSLDDIMQACELPRAEVEVLMGLHRKHSM